jgi:beta-glucosidase
MTAVFPKKFLWGASTSAHQIEGNNTNSDLWALENRERSPMKQRSGDACDSLHRWPEDLDLVSGLGLNAYRFSIEWARVEPAPGHVSRAMLEHYRRIITGCLERHITPIVTLHHFTLPKWLGNRGGWLSEDAPALFGRYAAAVRPILDGVGWVCTINEPNMVALVVAMVQNRGSGSVDAVDPDPTVTARLIEAHQAARAELAESSGLRTGWTVANQDVQAADAESTARAEDRQRQHEDQFLEVADGDDFIGVQAYSRNVIGRDGRVAPGPAVRRTQMDWEFYPEALEHAVRHTGVMLPGVPILVTENGIATAIDADRIEYTHGALAGLHRAISDGIDVRGYLHWSLLDNYEWGSFAPTFGLVAVDHTTFARTVKESGRWYGQVAAQNALPHAKDDERVSPPPQG